MSKNKVHTKSIFGVFDLKYVSISTNTKVDIDGYPWPYAPWVVDENMYWFKTRVGKPLVGVMTLYGAVEYASLSNWQKIEMLDVYAQNNRAEIDVIVEYRGILERNDTERMSFVEQFGNSTRHIVSNYHAYLHGLEYGFEDITFNKHGWLENAIFKLEEIPLADAKSGVMYQNSIRLGSGKNGKWAFGIHVSLSLTGFGYSPSIYEEAYNSREECLLAALDYAEQWFKSTGHSSSADSGILKKSLQLIKELRENIKQPSLAQKIVSDAHEVSKMVQGNLLDSIAASCIAPVSNFRPVQLTFF